VRLTGLGREKEAVRGTGKGTPNRHRDGPEGHTPSQEASTGTRRNKWYPRKKSRYSLCAQAYPSIQIAVLTPGSLPGSPSLW
jgi:hypothetical protein